ncbi:transcriptional repressor [Ruminococcaceae bacterium OttesenSCG-928-N02]|nr:transcriptional repressor [Ruminococcaceae bacterium OttesenSCG-928-N02]
MVQRNTIQRAMVLHVVKELKGLHPTAEDIYLHLQKGQSAISKATVYRNLTVLSESGAVLRLQVPEGADRYDISLTPHQHMHCTRCGEVKDVELSNFAKFMAEVELETGYSLKGSQLVFDGICLACMAKE